MCCSPWGHKGSDTTEQLNWKLYYRMGLEPLNTALKTLVFHKYLNKVVGTCSLDEIRGSVESLAEQPRKHSGGRESVCHLKGTCPRKSALGSNDIRAGKFFIMQDFSQDSFWWRVVLWKKRVVLDPLQCILIYKKPICSQHSVFVKAK